MHHPRFKRIASFVLSALLFGGILCSTGCSQSPSYPHSSPKELLTSIFTCLQNDDEAGFLTLLPTQEEARAMLESYTTDVETMEGKRDSIENHWEDMQAGYEAWGSQEFEKLKAATEGKVDLQHAVLGKVRSDIEVKEGLARGFAEATFIGDETGVIGFRAAPQAGDKGNYVLLETWGFNLSAGVMAP